VRQATGEGRSAWVAGLGREGIPCRQRGAAAGVAGGWWTRLAEAAATCKGARMKPTAAVTGGRTRAGRGRVFNGRQVAAEGPRDGTQEVKRAEVEGAEGVQGSRVTHQLLRRYRRRVFLILPGPIWSMLLRHDCYYCGRGGGRRIRSSRSGRGDEGEGGWDAVAWPSQFHTQRCCARLRE
jgi:hypothetical protein